MDAKLKLAKPPFLRSNDSIRKIMGDVLIALIPAEVAAVIFFGWYALFLMVSGALIAEGTEFFIMRVMRKRKNFVPDGSAAITGILLAMNVPSNLPFWALIIGILFAVAITKHAFGGLGYNIFNPALMGRIFLFISFPALMTTWPKVHAFAFFTNPVDVVTTATPLNLAKYSHQMTGYWNLFIGNVGGSLGETSALALIIGYIYLLIRKRVSWQLPLTYIGTVFVLSGITFAITKQPIFDPVFSILAGGLMLGALFMATDMVTSPITKKGQIIFGLGSGLVVSLVRGFGGYPEGVSFSIVLMNAFVPLIDRYVRPKRYGVMKNA